MINFQAEIRRLDTASLPTNFALPEPRRVRRQKLRAAATLNRSVGASAAPATAMCGALRKEPVAI